MLETVFFTLITEYVYLYPKHWHEQESQSAQ